MHSDVIGAVYEAANNERSWASALSALRHVTGARRMMLKFSAVDEAYDSEIYSASPFGEADWAIDGPATIYRQRFQYEDPVRYDGISPGEVRQLEDLIDRRAFVASGFYQEHCRPLGVDHAFFGYLGQIDGVKAWFSGARGSDQGPFSPAEVDLARGLLPHLARAAQMQRRTARQASQSAIYAQSVSALGVGAILLDQKGRIVHTNEAADILLTGSSPISRVGDRLRLAGAAQQALGSALCELAASVDLRGYHVVRAEDGCASVNLMIRRAADVVGGSVAYPIAFVVYVNRHTQPLPASAVDFAMKTFALSRSEARLAVLLAEGHSLEEVAACLGVTLLTARTYCKRTLMKTGASRQSQLVRLITDSLARLG